MRPEPLEQLLEEAFERVKGKLGNPLRRISFATNIDDEPVNTAAIKMDNFHIYVNPEFIVTTLGAHMGLNDALEGILEHEVGHYLFHPHSIELVILENIAMKGKKYGELAIQFYDDVNNNMRIVSNLGERTFIPEVYRSMNLTSSIEKVICTFYQYLTKKDFGMNDVTLNEEEEKAVDSLKKINFLNYDKKNGRIQWVKHDWRLNNAHLNAFYKIIEPLFEKDEQNGILPQEASLGRPIDVDDYDGSEIREALKDLIKEGKISPDDAKDFIEDHKEKFEDDSLPGGRYTENQGNFANRFIYESLASRYKIKLEQITIGSSDGVYPHHLEPFGIGDSLDKIDPFNSYGIIAPGLSKKWANEPISLYGEKNSTPDLMLILDDSGSMPDPSRETSPAVLGSFVVAKEYLRNWAKVGIVIFSDRTKTKDWTNRENEVLDSLVEFGNGSRTYLEVDKVMKLAAKNSVHDYVLITDGIIENADEVFSFLNSEADKGSRAYVIQIGSDKGITYNGRVKIHHVSKHDDLGKIILGDVRR